MVGKLCNVKNVKIACFLVETYMDNVLTVPCSVDEMIIRRFCDGEIRTIIQPLLYDAMEIVNLLLRGGVGGQIESPQNASPRNFQLAARCLDHWMSNQYDEARPGISFFDA